MLKKLLIIILINIIFISNVHALEINSQTAVLYNLNDNSIVLDIDKDKEVSIASLTKIMTCLVALDYITDMNQEVIITNDMLKGVIAANAYVIGLKLNQKVTIKDLLYATFIASGADAARGLAISLVGSEDLFVDKMNKKAEELKLHLHFANVVGLDDKNSYGTANDVAKLLMYALENNDFKEMFLTKEYILSDNSIKVKSSVFNSAAYYKIDIPYVEGGKTGYTINAGKCLASIAIDEKNNIKYLLVTTGANPTTKNAYHILDAKNIYEYYFDNYKYHNVLNIDDTIASIKVHNSDKVINIKSDIEIPLYYNNDFDENKISIKYDGLNEVSPFIDSNKELGEVSVYYENVLLKKININSDMLDTNILTLAKKHIGVICLSIIIFIMAILFIIHMYIKNKYLTKKSFV